ncbi:type II toxin-antitoxin system VapC family toxin [candidate division KSB1 bacterium]|nr:type II toxin-antitoxin system VapC family toxin [candidate division KSB1 bacterium]
MKPPAFIDTSHIIALVDTDDEYHALANLAGEALTGKMVTTEAVLIEFGNALSKAKYKQLAFDTIADLRNDPNIEIAPVDISLIDRALAMFGSYQDKDWSLTDCISFVVMRERGLAEALTADHHFEQAGFRAILRDLKNQNLHS